jgi:hypothetical protein
LAGRRVRIVYLACGTPWHVRQRTWSLAGDAPWPCLSCRQRLNGLPNSAGVPDAPSSWAARMSAMDDFLLATGRLHEVLTRIGVFLAGLLAQLQPRSAGSKTLVPQPVRSDGSLRTVRGRMATAEDFHGARK